MQVKLVLVKLYLPILGFQFHLAEGCEQVNLHYMEVIELLNCTNYGIVKFAVVGINRIKKVE